MWKYTGRYSASILFLKSPLHSIQRVSNTSTSHSPAADWFCATSFDILLIAADNVRLTYFKCDLLFPSPAWSFQQLFLTQIIPVSPQMKWDRLVPSCAWSTLVSLGRYWQFNPLQMGLTCSILCFYFQHVSSCSYCKINPTQMGLIGSIACLVFQRLCPTTITAKLTHFNWNLLIWTFIFPAAYAASLTQMKLKFLFHPVLGFSASLVPTEHIVKLTHLNWDKRVPSCAWSFDTSFPSISHWQINSLEMRHTGPTICSLFRMFCFQM